MRKNIYYNEFGIPVTALELNGHSYMAMPEGELLKVVEKHPGQHEFDEQSIEGLSYLCEKGETLEWDKLKRMMGLAVEKGFDSAEMDIDQLMKNLEKVGVKVKMPKKAPIGRFALRCSMEMTKDGEPVMRSDNTPSYWAWTEKESDVAFSYNCTSEDDQTDPVDLGMLIGDFLNKLVSLGFFSDYDVNVEGNKEIVAAITLGMVESGINK